MYEGVWMKIFLWLILSCSLLLSEALEDLLDTYTYNSDLSKQTKLENGGTVTIYTRQDIEQMQARTLKDLLKSHPIVRYQESRLGLPDMFYQGGVAASNSSNVRIYIDNQELTSATFGSGFLVSNNIHMNFIDHVEIYTRSPSYEFSTEPTYILIKLYTKLAERDRGGEIEASYGTKDFNEESVIYADELKDLSYVLAFTRRDDKKKTYYSHNIPIDRDVENYSFLSTLYTDENKLQVLIGDSDFGTSIGTSPTATYDTSQGEYSFVNVAYENTSFENTFLSVGYQYARIKGYFEENPGFVSPLSPEYEYDRGEEVLTLEVKNSLETEGNRLIFGAKYRYKSFDDKGVKINGFAYPSNGYNQQEVMTAYAEERYSLSDNNILSAAGQYSYVRNNANIRDDDLFQFRLNHTYIHDDFVFKSFLYRVETLVEPTIYIGATAPLHLKPQLLHALSEEIKYTQEADEIRLVLTYARIDNQVLQEPIPLNRYYNSEDELYNASGFIEYTHRFNTYNKVIANVNHTYVKERSSNKTAAFIRSLNRIAKFDIFNEVIYNHNNKNHEHYYDYSAGIEYHYDDTLSFSLKGENIFDAGYEDTYGRVNIQTLPSISITPDEPLMISPVEQRFYMSVEYVF